MTKFNKNNYVYTPLFCEENIWKLIDSLYMKPIAKPIDVLFIINKNNTIAVFEQKMGSTNKPVIWDYHVVLLAKSGEDLVIFDFDSLCDFPTPISSYFKLTFPGNKNLFYELIPFIKSIPADHYYKHFYSDRSHMKNIIDVDDFPGYPAIKSPENNKRLTLSDCRDTHTLSSTFNISLPGSYLNRCLSIF